MDLRTPGKFSKATALVQRGLILSEQCIGTYVRMASVVWSDLLFLVGGVGFLCLFICLVAVGGRIHKIMITTFCTNKL